MLCRYMFFIAFSFLVHHFALSFSDVENMQYSQQNNAKSMLSVQFVAPTALPQPKPVLTQPVAEKEVVNKKSHKEVRTETQPITPQKPKKIAAKSVKTRSQEQPLKRQKTVEKSLRVAKKTSTNKPIKKANSEAVTPEVSTHEPPVDVPQTPTLAPKDREKRVAERNTKQSLDAVTAQTENASKKTLAAQPSLPKMVSKISFSARPTPIDYPHSAKRRNLEGRVLVEVWLDKQGMQTKQLIVSSSGHQVLDNAALKTIRQWQFSRHQTAGQEIAYRVHVPINFELN